MKLLLCCHNYYFLMVFLFTELLQNNSRRRTPGGVYLQMLKEDKDVTQEMLGKIFEGEMSGHEMKKYFEEKRKKKQKKSYKRNSKGIFNFLLKINK